MTAHSAPAKTQLKLTEAFRAVYRRGRWVHSPLLSMGTLANTVGATRVGLRTRRGLKGAVVRNRLKRQLRALVYADALALRPGFDVVIVIHPPKRTAQTITLKRELLNLCKRTGLAR